MSDLTDLIAAQTADLFCGASSPFATAVTIGTDGVVGSFAAWGTWGDPPEVTTPQQGQVTTVRRARVVLLTTTVMSGFLTLTGEARQIRRNDTLTVAAGAYVGTWTVEAAIPDEGGAVQVDVVAAKRVATAVPGVRP